MGVLGYPFGTVRWKPALVRGQSRKYLSAVAHFRGQFKGKDMGVTRLFPSDEAVAVQGTNGGTSVCLLCSVGTGQCLAFRSCFARVVGVKLGGVRTGMFHFLIEARSSVFPTCVC